MRKTPLTIELPGWLTAKLAGAGPLPDVRARMAFAIELSRENAERGTGGPFGAVIADTETGRLVSGGVNLVEHQTNSVLHAEIVAIMFAERALGAWTLAKSGLHKYEIVTSSAPCAMCLGAVLWSGVAALICGARTEDVQAIGFDEGPVFDESFDYLQQRGVLIVRDVMREEARAALREYRARGGTIYNR
jgi:tRNA(Arg) A34 adenosine deaminase TadA